ncbi:hypothetical protein K432DRAFT_385455 [Lepidopterella palustris CBS 459.81]|uniref:Uncharacterized protein n=1 Tax=Lepidopterella palustris CBS 459.81 TaxID=1314670 RepID=A0A8E2E369_9PEZI|nr:hypothetical protein K432DRAFT_385455 [Lepidopterella palustris CBS 459.81]
MSTGFPFSDPQRLNEVNQPEILAVRFSFGPRPKMATEGSLPRRPDSPDHVTFDYAARPFQSSYQSQVVQRRRFKVCHGTLYHQLVCGHRIRTDLVEDCGLNCLDGGHRTQFYCQACIDIYLQKIWHNVEEAHNATYPPLDRMSPKLYGQWYSEHRQLEAKHSVDRDAYQARMKRESRPSVEFIGIDWSEDDSEMASEIDSLGISSEPFSEKRLCQSSNRHQTRSQLPGDDSERLHWALGQLDFARGSCGPQFSTAQQPQAESLPVVHPVWEDEEL